MKAEFTVWGEPKGKGRPKVELYPAHWRSRDEKV